MCCAQTLLLPWTSKNNFTGLQSQRPLSPLHPSMDLVEAGCRLTGRQAAASPLLTSKFFTAGHVLSASLWPLRINSFLYTFHACSRGLALNNFNYHWPWAGGKVAACLQIERLNFVLNEIKSLVNWYSNYFDRADSHTHKSRYRKLHWDKLPDHQHN